MLSCQSNGEKQDEGFLFVFFFKFRVQLFGCFLWTCKPHRPAHSDSTKLWYLHGADHGAQGEHSGRVPQRGLAVKRALRVHQQHGDLRHQTRKETDPFVCLNVFYGHRCGKKIPQNLQINLSFLAVLKSQWKTLENSMYSMGKNYLIQTLLGRFRGLLISDHFSRKALVRSDIEVGHYGLVLSFCSD